MTATSIPPTAPEYHTMGDQLWRYVLPKIPHNLLSEVHSARVYGSNSLSLLRSAKPLVGKQFNWRRPEFVRIGSTLHCVTPPGRDYAWHYAKLIATAAQIVGRPIPVLMEQPTHIDTQRFIDWCLPEELPPVDVVVLGYVHQLFRGDSPCSEWQRRRGFGWRHVSVEGRSVLLLGCEFSYWGDLAGSLVGAIVRRGISPWVIYVGKLGTLVPTLAPNQWLVTGRCSAVESQAIEWHARLTDCGHWPHLLTGVRHVTMPSVIDETTIWAAEAAKLFDVVDPEIGHMGRAASGAGASFDYLHLITDNLVKDFAQGLYDERSKPIAAQRSALLEQAETIIAKGIAQTC